MKYTIWKMLFHIMGVLLVITVVVDLFSSTLSVPKYLFSGLELTWVYGLAYRKAIWDKNTWKMITTFILVCLILIIGIPLFVVGYPDSITGLRFSFSFNTYALIVILLMPIKIYALYIYSFKSKDIWGT